MSIELKNLDGILKELDGVANETTINAALGKACALVEREAKKKAPANKDDGNTDLRKSITSSIENLTGIVYTPFEYAPYVEYGTGLFAENGNGRKDVPWRYQDEKNGEWHITSGQHPQPFLRPALNENREKIIRILKEGLRNK